MITLETSDDLISFIRSHKLTKKEVNNLFSQIGLHSFFVDVDTNATPEEVAEMVQKWFSYQNEKPLFLDD